MTRLERERHIERYLSGSMTPAEEQDFFIQAALDREMRYELKALMTVDSAIRKEREAESGEHTALRTRVAAMLVAAPAAEQPGPSLIGRTGTGSITAAQKILPLQWLGMAAATIAITAVLFFLTDPFQTSPVHSPRPAQVQTRQAPEHREQPRPSTAPEEGVVNAPVPSGQVPEGTSALRNDAARPTETASSRSQSSQSTTMEKAEEIRTRNSRRADAASASNGSRSSSPSNRNNASGTDLAPAQAAQEHDEQEIAAPKRRNDSLSVGVNIKFKNR